MYCSKCGKEIKNESGVCEFCDGETAKVVSEEEQLEPGRAKGIVSLVFGACSIVSSVAAPVALAFAIVALVLGKKGLKTQGRTLAKVGRGLGLAGLIMNIFVIIGTIIGVIVYCVIFFLPYIMAYLE